MEGKRRNLSLTSDSPSQPAPAAIPSPVLVAFLLEGLAPTSGGWEDGVGPLRDPKAEPAPLRVHAGRSEGASEAEGCRASPWGSNVIVSLSCWVGGSLLPAGPSFRFRELVATGGERPGRCPGGVGAADSRPQPWGAPARSRGGRAGTAALKGEAEAAGQGDRPPSANPFHPHLPRTQPIVRQLPSLPDETPF